MLLYWVIYHPENFDVKACKTTDTAIIEAIRLTMEDPAGIEYYSIPENQMPDEMIFGGEIYNYGYNDELNVKLDGMIDGTNIMSDVTYELIETDSTRYVETDFFDISSENLC